MNNKYKKAFSIQNIDVYYTHADMALKLQKYLLKNKSRLTPYEPLREVDYYQYDAIKKRLTEEETALMHDQALSLVMISQDGFEIVGKINFTNFIFGYFQTCYLGFSIDADFEGKGIMKKCLVEAINLIKHKYDIHRIMANHLPSNYKSEMLLKRVGFVKEGYAKSYIKINGRWENHMLNALVFEEPVNDVLDLITQP